MNLHKNYKPILDKWRKLFILITKYQLLATAPLALSGCMGIYENSFECPPGRGVGCKSISEVHDFVDQCSEKQCPQDIWYAPQSEANHPIKPKRSARDAYSI